MVVHELANFFSPWNTLYSGSKAVSTAVTSVHILALLFGGGLALASDRSTLRALKRPVADRLEQLRELRAVHRPVLVALTVLFVSGAAMAVADVETFAVSPYFWVKIGLVAALLANGLYLFNVEKRLNVLAATELPPDRGPGLWLHLRRASVLSLALWGLTALAGAVLAGAA
jgi:hypothetical protein